MILLLKITKQNGGRQTARKLRDWYPGAIYHIMHRGVRRKPIFEDEMDHQVLLQIIKTSLSKYNCWLHAYCLMTNHVHLLLETGDIEIGKFMKYMSECYGRCPVQELLDSLEPKLLAKTLRTIDLLEMNGPLLREPYSKPLENGIFELRTKQGSDITRVL